MKCCSFPLPNAQTRIEGFNVSDWNEQLREMREEYDSTPLRKSDLKECPIEQFSLWLKDASDAGVPDSNACSLATVDEESRPVARAILLKGMEGGRFVFYTNFNSRKATQLINSSSASMHFPWFALQRQVMITGKVAKFEESKTEEYFRSRPYFSKLGAWASMQSEPLDSRETLEKAFIEAREKYGDDPPRPPHWGGFALQPDTIEFWQGGPHRLHDRFLFERDEIGDWNVRRLYP
jgi:pyridoxamine 5'-phosphate oxidase